MQFSIRSALVGGFLGLQIVPAAVILASSYWTSQQALLGHAKDIMENIATFTVHEAQSYLGPAQDAATLTQRLADSEVVSSRNKAVLEQYFYEQLALNSNFAGIYLGTPDGEFVYVSRMDTKVPGGFRTKVIHREGGRRVTDLVWKDARQREIGRERDLADTYDPRKRPWYSKAAAQRATVWTDPYIFFTSRKPGLTAASPAFDRSGALSGVVGVDIEIDEISTFLASLRVGKSGRAFILDRNGDVVAFPDPSLLERPAEAGDGSLRLPRISELDDVLARKAFEALGRPAGEWSIEGPVFGSFLHEDRTYHTMFAPFSSDQWPWAIGIYLPEDDYLGPIKSNRRDNIYVVVALGVLASLVGLAIARSVVRPMTAFRAEATAVSREDLDSAFDKHSVIKEIQDTADTFSAMKDSLKATRERNEELNRGLREQAEHLRSKEMHLRATFASLVNFSDALVVLDQTRQVRFVNPAAETLFGAAGIELIGKAFPVAVEIEPGEIRIDSGRGPGRAVEMQVVDTEWEGRPALLVALHDVTERCALEEEIRWRAQTMEALHGVTLDLAAQRDLPELLTTIGGRASDLLQAKGAGVFLYREEHDALECVLWHRLNPSAAESLIRRGEGVTGKVLDSGKPLIVNDYDSWEGRHERHNPASFNACVAVPILWARRPIGVLIVADDPPRRFQDADVDLLGRFAPLAGAALEQRRLLDEAEVLCERARQDADTKSALLREVNHRVHNNLSSIIGLLYAERRHASKRENPAAYREMLQDLITRMQGLATVHTMLSATEWRPVALQELTEKVIDAALQTLSRGHQITARVGSSTVRVSPAQASSLAMVLNELTTNAVKHGGAPGGPKTITTTVREREPDTIELVFRDDGPGFPDAVLTLDHYSTGLHLIRNFVTQDLGGTLELCNDSGAVTTIRFPNQRA